MKYSQYLLIFLIGLLYFKPYLSIAQTEKILPIAEEIDFELGFATELNGKYCFLVGEDNQFKNQLWISDGTASGTLPLSQELSYGQGFTKVDNKLFFVEYTSNTASYGLYVSGGTPESTQRLKTIHQVTANIPHYNRRPQFFVAHQGLLFFVANGGTDFQQLWRSDGTVEGTFALPISFNFTTPQGAISHLKVVSEEKIIFQVSEGTRWELWETDATSEGTKKIDLTFPDSFPNTPNTTYFNQIVMIEDVIYSTGFTSTPREYILFRSDLTQEGTVNLTSLLPESQGISSIGHLIDLNEELYFFVFRSNQAELYKLESTEDEVVLVKTLENVSSGQIRDLYNGGNYLGFIVSNPLLGDELWVSDGTTEGTKLLKDIWKGAASAFENDLGNTRFTFVALQGYHYFAADDGVHGQELWRTDGTAEDTQLAADVEKGVVGSLRTPQQLVVIGDKIYFIGKDGRNQNSVYTYTYQAEIPEQVMTPFWREQEWYQTIGRNELRTSFGRTYHDALAGDSQSNIYVSGKSKKDGFGSKLVFYDQGINLEENPEIGNDNFDYLQYFAKFDKLGNLQWAKHIGEDTYLSTALTTDNNDMVYIAGAFSRSAVLDDWSVSQNGGGFYLAKYDPDGNRIWTVTVGLSRDGEIFDITTDNQQNIYITGVNNSSINFGNGIILNSDVSPRFFIAKYSSQGEIIWAKDITQTDTDFREVAALKVDANQNIYTLLTRGTSDTWSTCKFSDWNIRVDCFQPDGSARWSSTYIANDLTIARSLDISPLGDLFIIGRLRGNLQVDDYTLESKPLSNGCNISTGFFIHLDSRNGEVKSVRVDNPSYSDYFQISFMPDNSYWISGIQQNFGQKYENYQDRDFRSNARQLFLKRFDYLGNLMQERYFNTRAQDDYYFNPKFLIDNENHLVLTDIVLGRLDTIPNAIRNSNQNVFLMRLKNDELTYQNFEPEYPEVFVIAPNPTQGEVLIKSNHPNWNQYELLIFNNLGQNIQNFKKTSDSEFLKLNLSNLRPGTYILVFYNNQGKVSKRIIKI